MATSIRKNCIALQFIGMCILFCVFSINSFAQKKQLIEVVQANDLYGTKKKGKTAQRLIGDVILKHKGALMYCDSAFLYKESNTMDAFGSIRINQGDTINLYGDYLLYQGNIQLATVTGEVVRLESPDFTLLTDKLLYDRVANKATYYSGATITSKNDSNVLVSEIGYYFANSALFTFKNNVVLTNPDFTMVSDTLKYYTNTEIVNFLGPTTIKGDTNLIYCENGWYDTRKDQSKYFENAYIISDGKRLEGDTLYYDRNLGYGQADGDIQITDTVENIIINGEHGEIYEKVDSAIVCTKSLLTQLFDQDSMFMHADTFKVFKRANGEKNLSAYYGVRIYKSDLQGVCDSISYSFIDSTIRLFKNPILWSDNNQLTADTINLLTKNNKIDQIYLDQSAFIISEVDPTKYNQIKGKTMLGFFKNSKLKRIEVRGNGQTTYYGKDEKEKFIGVNVAESSDINFMLNKEGVEQIVFLKMPKAKMHPMGTLNDESELRYPGFVWFIKKRPTSKAGLFQDKD